MSLKSKPSNGTATGKKGSIRKGAGKSFKTETPKKGLSKANIPSAGMPTQASSDNPYGGSA